MAVIARKRSVTDRQTDGQTDKPKLITPLFFFEKAGDNNDNNTLYLYIYILALSHLKTLSDTSAAYNFWKNVEAKGEIAHDDQFLLSPQYFQLNEIIILSLMEIVHTFDQMFSMFSAADILHVGKGKYRC